ncbi:protein kinase domain-containing protein [Streptomyces nitrosporeus]|uniref:serine/threonine-protein kinase n=1 Tax=Streptomyces nitrosporeus TaxID=28894 RepID=UPI0039A07720
MDQAQGTESGLVLAGRYRLGDVLGRGGMGKVWRAHDEVLGRTVAVKELTAGLYATEADRAVLHARTQKEARAAARITHPGVVTVHDVIDHDQRPWIVMQYVDGPSLADATKEGGETGPREAARIGLHVLGALRAAHGAGVLHRDVKPGNVLLAKDGTVLLTDFGIAAIEGDSTITRTGELVGSIDYLAPERVRGGDPGPASDLWSLGATLYTAVEGRSPFRRTSPISTMQAVVGEEAPYPERGGVLAPVITALLRKDPAERPSAAEAERMLLDAMEGREPRAAQAHIPTQRFSGDELHEASAPDGATTRLPLQAPPSGREPAYGPPSGRGPVYSPPSGREPVYGPPPGHTAPAAAPRRSRGRRRTAVLVLVVAALVGGAAGLFLIKEGDRAAADGQDRSATAPDTPAPSRPAATPSAGGSPAPSAGGSPAAGRTAAGEVPDGWIRVQDPEGFSLAVPRGWTRQTDGGQIDYTPDNGAHRIRISVDPAPDFDNPYTHMLSIEKDLEKRLPGYDRLTLHSNVFRDRPGSLWEFTWVESKDHPGPRHGIDQMYFGEPGGPEYALYMTGPEEDWAESRQLFETMLRSWRPPPTSD